VVVWWWWLDSPSIWKSDALPVRHTATPSGLTSAHLHHLRLFYRLDAVPVAQPTVSKH